MATLKGIEMKRVFRSTNFERDVLRRATIRIEGKKIGTVTETIKNKSVKVDIFVEKQMLWDDAVETYWNENEPNVSISMEATFTFRLMELAEDETHYLIALKKGHFIYAVYHDRVPIEGTDGTRRNGRSRHLHTDEPADVEELESTTLRDVLYDKKIYLSLDDFHL